MPVLIAALWGAFLSILGSAVGQVLVALAIGVSTYTGVSTGLDFLKSNFISAVNGLPPQIIGLWGLMKIGECFSIISSAVVMKFTMSGMKDGAIKKWVKR